MKAVLFTFRTKKSDWHQRAVEEFVLKLQPFLAVEVKVLQGRKDNRNHQDKKKSAEGETILENLKSDDWVVLLDERGQSWSSIQFSENLNRWLSSGKKRIVFVIGGAYGVTDSVHDRADVKLSLSKMVMNHLVAEIVFLEQLYRGFAILKNLPYHNE